jgi:hypothetical protein
MVWKSFISLLAITPRRKVVATAFVYGPSLTVRFTTLPVATAYPARLRYRQP